MTRHPYSHNLRSVIRRIIGTPGQLDERLVLNTHGKALNPMASFVVASDPHFQPMAWSDDHVEVAMGTDAVKQLERFQMSLFGLDNTHLPRDF